MIIMHVIYTSIYIKHHNSKLYNIILSLLSPLHTTRADKFSAKCHFLDLCAIHKMGPVLTPLSWVDSLVTLRPSDNTDG